MTQAKALAVKDHHHPSHLSSLLLHNQLKQGEDSGEEVKESHLQTELEKTTSNWKKDLLLATSCGGHWPSLSTTTLLPSSSRISGLKIKFLLHTCSRAEGGPALM